MVIEVSNPSPLGYTRKRKNTMINIIKCWLFGHKKYDPKSLYGKDILCLQDELNQRLVIINVCERCGKVYAEFPID